MIPMLLVIALVIAVALGGLVAGSLLAGRTRGASLAREMRRLTDEQRRVG